MFWKWRRRDNPEAEAEEQIISVLLICDNPDCSETTRLALQGGAFDVYAFQNGSEALSFLADGETPVDLLMFDLLLPQTDGKAFVQRARARLGKAPLPPVLVLLDAPDDEEFAHSVYASDLLPKPIDAATLMAHVRNLVPRPTVQ
jgi:DNA-binding response OmpR family regulator